MCKPYRTTSNADAMRQLFRVTSEALSNLPVYTEIYPDKDAPVISDVAGIRDITTMR